MNTDMVVPEPPRSDSYHDPQSGKTGRGPLLWLLLLLVVAAGTPVAYFYAKSGADRDKAALQKQITDLKAQVKKASEKTLTITEWGVKIPATNLPEGISYTYRNGSAEAKNNVGVTELVLFDSSTLTTLGKSKQPSVACDVGSLGVLTRATLGGGPSADANHDGVVAHVGGFYYSYSHGQDSCWSDKTVTDAQTKQQAAILGALKEAREAK